MKKIMLAILVLVSISTFAQKKEKKEKEIPPYYGKISLGVNLEKKDSTNVGKTAEIDFRDYYGGFICGFSREQPMKKGSYPGLRKMTSITVGGGFRKTFTYDRGRFRDGHYYLNFGGGPTAMITPKPLPDSLRTKNSNDVFWGARVIANLEGDISGIDAELSLTYTFLPRDNDSAWAENVFIPQLEFKKFFGDVIGVGAGFKALIYNTSEPQISGRHYYNTRITDTRLEIYGTISAKFKNFFVQAKCVIPRISSKYSDNTPSGLIGSRNGRTENIFMGISVGYTFANRGD